MGSDSCIVLRDSTSIRTRARVATCSWKEHGADHADAEYITSMHPGVALALADWLDRTVTDDEYGEVTGFDEALAVARACLSTSENEEAQR
jgi:hypothetical protein